MPATLRSVLQTTLSALRRPASTDADLLAAFASVRDEAAFAELVRRHGALVLGASLRTVGDRGTAEDVFQATFLLLARKADSISWGPTVGPWLYQAVRRIGAKARASAARRSFSPLPHDIPAPATDPAAALARAEMRAALDDALAALPADLRDPLVLCYLEGLTQDEAAAALRCSPATIKGRVTRGRERLRKLLERRGVSLSAALSGLLVSEAVVSASAVAATARAATVFVTTGAASPKVLALLCGTSAGVKLAAGLFGLVLACAAIAAGLVGGSPGPKASAKRVVRAAPPAPAVGEPLPAGAVARLGTRRLCGYPEPTSVVFSPDGKKVASKGLFGVIVWDAATGRPLVERHRIDARNTLAWRADGTGVAVVRLADGSHFVSAFTDPDEKLPASQPGGAANAPKPGPDGLESFALSPDGTRLAVVRNPTFARFTIDILLATTGRGVSALKRERTLGPFEGPFQEIRYTAGGGLMFLSAKGKVIGEWSLSLVDPVKNKITRTTSIPEPGASVFRYMFSLSADGRLAAFPPRGKHDLNNHEDTIRVWDLAAGKELCSLPFPKSLGYGIGHAFTPDGKHLITSTDKAYFQVWNLETGKETARYSGPDGPMTARNAMAVGVSPDGKRFATARRDGRVDIWHTATGKSAVPFDTHRDAIHAVAVSPDGLLAATLGFDGTARVWELATGKPGCVIPAPLAGDGSNRYLDKRRVVFAPDGRGLLFSSKGKLAMASPTTGKRLELPRGLRDQPGNIGGFTADGKTLMTFAANEVRLWDWSAGTARVTITVPIPDALPGRKGKPGGVVVGSATLSPDGRFVFTHSIGYEGDPALGGGHQATNDIWDARTGKRLHQVTKPRLQYPPAAFAPDGRVMYLGGHGIAAPVAFDPPSGRLLRRFTAPKSLPEEKMAGGFGLSVDPLAASPDGRLLAAGTGTFIGDRGVWLYEVASGKLVKKLAGHDGPVKALVFSPDGRRLVSVGGDQTGLVWDVTIAALAGKPAGMSVDNAWAGLGDLDPETGYAAINTLTANPAKALPLLRAKLRAAPALPDADVDKVIARLDAEAFADREKATADLERFGPKAVPRATSRIAGEVSAEVRGRLGRFLDRYIDSEPSPHYLRCVRGVAVVEAIGTDAARALLAEWAKGPKDDTLTREAAAAMRRKAGP